MPVVVEHEVVEQIETEAFGWAAERVLALMAELGAAAPDVRLVGMVRAGVVGLVWEGRAEMAGWERARVLRERKWGGVRVVATERGLEAVYSGEGR